MPTPEEQFSALQARHTKLTREHAVLESQAKAARDRETDLKQKLEELGIDPSRPEEELARIESEIANFVETASKSLDEFEGRLKGKPPLVMAQIAPTPEPAAAQPEPSALPPVQPQAVADDIDIG